MIVGALPLEVAQEVRRLLRSGSRAASQNGYSLSDGQNDPLNKGSVESPRVT